MGMPAFRITKHGRLFWRLPNRGTWTEHKPEHQPQLTTGVRVARVDICMACRRIAARCSCK